MIADKIMNWCWGLGTQFWDKNSPAHKFWKHQVKKKKAVTFLVETKLYVQSL